MDDLFVPNENNRRKMSDETQPNSKPYVNPIVDDNYNNNNYNNKNNNNININNKNLYIGIIKN